eukprot:14958835-Heterocapsa_arctica.AAC.1
MHPMVQQVCKGKTYTRRNDIQHIEHQKPDNKKITYSQIQTRFGEEQTKQANSLDPEKLGPEEEGKRIRDCTARQNMTNITILQMTDYITKKRRMEELHSWETLAHLKGWQGVWEPAKVIDKYQDGVR